MSECIERPLSELADIRVSNVDKKSLPGEKPVLLCNYMDAYSNDYIRSEIAFMEATASAFEIAKFKVECGDVVITKDSETPDDIGIPAVVMESIENLVCGYHLALLKNKQELVDPVYLCKQLASERAARYFGQHAAGSTRYGLSTGALANIQIPLPPLVKQRFVAKVLTSIDITIEKTNTLITKYQQIKAGLMHDLFTRGVLPNGQLRPPREQSPELYQETAIGWIPRGWGVASLVSISEFITSGSRGWADYYASDGALFIRIGNLTRENPNFRWDNIQRVRLPKNSEGSRTRVANGDILISITADLGIAAVVGDDLGEAYVNQHIALVRPNSATISSRFVGHYLGTKQAQFLFQKMNDSGAKAGLNLPAISRYLIPIPTVCDEAYFIRSILDSTDTRVSTLRKESEKLRAQKLGLMQDLLTGKVPVKVGANRTAHD